MVSPNGKSVTDIRQGLGNQTVLAICFERKSTSYTLGVARTTWGQDLMIILQWNTRSLIRNDQEFKGFIKRSQK